MVQLLNEEEMVLKGQEADPDAKVDVFWSTLSTGP